jgi:diguanylate cyclase
MANRKMVNRANDTPFGQVTFSAGIADVFAFEDPRAALGAADQALYRAKAEGRNRIILIDHPRDRPVRFRDRPAVAINCPAHHP